MSLPTRACLAMALAWAGGFGLPGPAGVELLALLVVIGLAWWWQPEPATRAPARLAGAIEALALALLIGLLARTLGRVVIASPAALWSIPAVGLAWLALGRGEPSRTALAPALILVALAAGLAGARFEAAGPQPRGRVDGSPVLGVHPRQAIAVRVDGFGPHDVIVDDYVDPPGGQGYDPERWAARLEAELHAVAERNYADGPARARVAFEQAEVEVREALVPPADRELYTSLLGLVVRSGTTGEGSTVEFVCPGQAIDPRPPSPAPRDASCPRKYANDGSTGLGLASRFPGYAEVVGRDRARLARALGWPSGDPRADRRSLALESGAWALVLLAAAWLLGRGGRRDEPGALAVVAALALTLGLALSGSASADSIRGGPTLLAIALVLAPAPRRGEPAALGCALLIALLAASPLAGRGDAVELVDVARDRLVDLGLGWAGARALASSLAVVPLLIGAAIGAATLLDRSRAWTREARHTRAAALAFGLALTLTLGLTLRKPIDDLALLASAAALLLLANVRLRTRAQQLGLTLLATLAAAAPLLDGDAQSPLGLGVGGVAAALCLWLGWGALRAAPSRG